jgi:hypothetical protein
MLSKLNQASIGNMKFQVELDANTPLDITKDQITFKISFQQNTNTKLVEDKVTIIDATINDGSGTKIATATTNDELRVGSSKSYTYNLNNYYMEDKDSNVDIKYTFRVKYYEAGSDSNSVEKYGTISGTFSKWKFVKPGALE